MSKKLTIEEFISKAIVIHGYIYDYSKTKYSNYHTKLDIVCQIHGIFKQTPANHISGHKCIYCAGLNKKTTEEFIERAKNIHRNKYDYSKTIYTKSKNNVIIGCKKHGDFNQSAITHLRGSMCPECNKEKRRKSNKSFILESKDIHGNKYDYSKTNYINSRTKVNIICKKHGVFIQNPRLHLDGKGCPICKQSKGEKIIKEYMEINKINFIQQQKFDKCKLKNKLAFDFYLPEYNICIEYNGRQHYQPVDIFGGENGFNLQLKRDKIKEEYCKNNNIPLLIIRYNENVNEKLNALFFSV